VCGALSQTWARHSATAIRSSLGYVIERKTFVSDWVDTVFTCWLPSGQMLGCSSGKGIDAARAKAMCDRRAEQQNQRGSDA
jgi:hypothetical protein